MDFDQYVADRRRALTKLAVVLSGDPVLAGDIVADVLGAAFERWAHIGGLAHPHAYVRRMIVNDYLGRRRRAARTSARDDIADLLEPAADHADAHADHAALAVELIKLPPRQRAAVVLRFYEGLSYAEVAAVLGTGENAVRSNLLRALRTLRVQLTAADEPSPTAARTTLEVPS